MGQPLAHGCQGCLPHGHGTALAALAGDVRCRILQIQPPGRGIGSLHIQAHQFAHTQAAAIQQLDDRVVACGQGSGHQGVRATLAHWRAVVGQGHRLVHRQGLGQRPRCLGRLHAFSRVGHHAPFAAPPAIKAAPGRQDDGHRSRRQPTLVQTRQPATHMVCLHTGQRHALIDASCLQPRQSVTDHGHAARRQAARHRHMLQVPRHRGIARGSGCVHEA